MFGLSINKKASNNRGSFFMRLLRLHDGWGQRVCSTMGMGVGVGLGSMLG